MEQLIEVKVCTNRDYYEPSYGIEQAAFSVTSAIPENNPSGRVSQSIADCRKTEKNTVVLLIHPSNSVMLISHDEPNS